MVAIVWAAFGMADYASEALPAFIIGFTVHWLLMRWVRTGESPSAVQSETSTASSSLPVVD